MCYVLCMCGPGQPHRKTHVPPGSKHSVSLPCEVGEGVRVGVRARAGVRVRAMMIVSGGEDEDDFEWR